MIGMHLFLSIADLQEVYPLNISSNIKNSENRKKVAEVTMNITDLTSTSFELERGTLVASFNFIIYFIT